MFKIACIKCICFVFLVILILLSCSGFRIDNLVMTHSKKNFHISNSFLIEKHFDSLIVEQKLQRIRHEKLRRLHFHNRKITDSSKVFPFHNFDMEGNSRLNKTIKPFYQNPTSSDHNLLFQTRPILFRTQRSSKRKNKKNRKQKQTEDITVKAYKAQIVLRAEILGRNSSSNNQWVFKVNKIYKDVQHISKDQFMLDINFTETKSAKSKLNSKHEYLLFLNASSSNKFFSTAAPQWIRQRKFKEKPILRVCQTNFVPKAPKIVDLREIGRSQNKRVLRCLVRGLPVPKIFWRHHGKELRPNKMLRIQYKRKESRLTIRKRDAEYTENYECVAEGVDGRIASKSITIKKPIRTPSEIFSGGKECNDNTKNYCHNGGTCYSEDVLEELYCICPTGFSGSRCETKEPSNTNMYTQPSISDCKMGLSTKHFC